MATPLNQEGAGSNNHYQRDQLEMRPPDIPQRRSSYCDYASDEEDASSQQSQLLDEQSVPTVCASSLNHNTRTAAADSSCTVSLLKEGSVQEAGLRRDCSQNHLSVRRMLLEHLNKCNSDVQKVKVLNHQFQFQNHQLQEPEGDEAQAHNMSGGVEDSLSVSLLREVITSINEINRNNRRDGHSSFSSASVLSNQTLESRDKEELQSPSATSARILRPKVVGGRRRQSHSSSASSGSRITTPRRSNSLTSASSSSLFGESSVDTLNMPLLESISFHDTEDLVSLFDGSSSSLFVSNIGNRKEEEQQDDHDEQTHEDKQEDVVDEDSFAGEEGSDEWPTKNSANTTSAVKHVFSVATRGEGHRRGVGCKHFLGHAAGPDRCLFCALPHQSQMLPATSRNELRPIIKKKTTSGDSRWDSSSDHTSSELKMMMKFGDALWPLSDHSSCHTNSSSRQSFPSSGRPDRSTINNGDSSSEDARNRNERWNSFSDHSSSHSSQQFLVLPARSREGE